MTTIARGDVLVAADTTVPGPPSAAAAATSRPPRLATAIVAGLAGVVAVACAIVQTGWGMLRVEPFFDEMWRLDLVRAAQPFEDLLPGVTPVPPGWVGIFRVLAPVLGVAPTGYRLVTYGCLGVGVAALVVLLREWCRPRRHDRGAEMVALATAGAAALSVAVFAIVDQVLYVNQYLFEVAYGVVLTSACVLIGRRRFALPVFVAGAAAAPLFVIAPLALLPPLLAAAGWWAATADPARRVRRLAVIAGAGAVSALLAVAVYLGLYRDMSEVGELKDLWAGATVSRAGLEVLPDTLSWVRAGVFGHGPATTGALGVLTAVLLLGSFAVGAVTITRRWAWYPLLIGFGWISLLVGGIVTDGPVTAVRVTTGFYWVVYVTIALGFFHAIAWVLGRVRLPRRVQVGVLAASLVAVLVSMWSPEPVHPEDAFARGLLGDLDVVAASTTRENLVLTYHFMAHVYTHDRLVNRAPAGRDYVVLGQRAQHDRQLVGNVDALARRHLTDGGTLWCVLPYALGPERSQPACRVPSTARETVRHVGVQALVLGYRITPAP